MSEPKLKFILSLIFQILRQVPTLFYLNNVTANEFENMKTIHYKLIHITQSKVL